LAAIRQLERAPEVTPRVWRLSNSKYLAYIEHQVRNKERLDREYYLAGTFANDAEALAAAERLMQTFLASVMLP
jgi:hypothetical protein